VQNVVNLKYENDYEKDSENDDRQHEKKRAVNGIIKRYLPEVHGLGGNCQQGAE
jgi:hypothetical protein